MGYASVLATFKINHEAYVFVKDDEDSKVPKMDDKDNDRKIMRWSPIFNYCISNSCASRGLLYHVLREGPIVPDEIMFPLLANYYYV